MTRESARSIVPQGIGGRLLRTTNPQPSLWETILPAGILGLPAELAQVDALLDDPEFLAPFATAPDPLMPAQHHGQPPIGRSRTRTRRRPCRAARTHSPHSRPFSPSSGGPAAIRRPPARPRRPPGVQVQQQRPRRTTVLTHLGPPSCRRQTSASYARSQVLSGLLPHRRKQTPPRFRRRATKAT
jgi:hypothetical protein